MTQTPNSPTQSNAGAFDASFVCRSALDQLLVQGAQQMLAAAIEAEVQQYIDQHRALRDQSGRRLVVRNGRLPNRRIETCAGLIEVSQPRVYDRREGNRFTSLILPPYARRSPSMDCLMPLLYPKGVSTNDIPEALEPILGQGAKGLSPTNITKLTEGWHEEFQKWDKRSLEGKKPSPNSQANKPPKQSKTVTASASPSAKPPSATAAPIPPIPLPTNTTASSSSGSSNTPVSPAKAAKPKAHSNPPPSNSLAGSDAPFARQNPS
jgi:hypothetical protein